MRAEKRGVAEIGSFGQDWEDVNGQCMTEGRRQPTRTIGHLGDLANLKIKAEGYSTLTKYASTALL